MPSNPLNYTSGVAGVVALATNVEKVVATLSGVTIPTTGRTTILNGFTVVTSGSTTTAVVVRIRRDTLTGTLIGDQTGQSVITAAAGTNAYEVRATDTQGDGFGFVYVLTVQDTGGGTGGTTVYSMLNAVVI